MVKVLEHEQALIGTSGILGELDSLLALAVGSSLYNWVAPQMTTENDIHIEGGRHPVQEFVVSSFIKNDCHLSGDASGTDQDFQSGDNLGVTHDSVTYPSTLVLTGPNHSGKSVYMKQVALIVYLAHIGCYVPADRARIGITDRILTRIATRETVSRNESAFSVDLRQVAFAMNFATRQSLVLIDEFGKGTDSSDGPGLMTALLRHLSAPGPDRPKVLAATHFHEIFETKFIRQSPQMTFAHMEVLLDFDTTVMEDQVTYLYQLVPGRSSSSFGTRCAALNGIDEEIVRRGEEIMILLVKGEDLEAYSKLSDDQAERLKEAEAVARCFMEETLPNPKKGRGTSKSPSLYHDILNRVLAGVLTDE